MTLAHQTAASPAPAEAAARVATPLARAMLGAIFLVSGAGKIGGYAGAQGYMEAMGVPGALLPAVIAFEIAAPLALIVGFQARLAAFLLAGFSLVTAAIFHANFADQMQQIMFLKNIAIAGGLLMIVATGPGPFSFGARR
jgi:putative oxidoreductase